MSDGISFDITANDKTAAGVSSAIGNINKLGKQGGGFASAATVMDKWTKSQYTAAAAGSLLTDKATYLAKQIDSGKMSISQARQEYSAFEKQMKSNVWQAMSFSEKYGVVREKVAAVGTEMMKFGAAGAIVAVAGKQMYNFARSGAEMEYTQTRFDRLSRSMGTTSNVLMSQLRVATKGTVSDMQLAKNGADLFQLGLARTADEAVRLSKVQTALGMDTGELTLALANQSKRRLDQLGLSLTKFNEIEGKLKDKGMSKEDAFREAFMLTAEDTIRTTGNMADSSLGSFQRLEAGGANIWNQMKMSAPNANMGWLFGGDTVAQTADKVGMFLNGMSQLMSGQNVLDFSGGLGADSWVRAAQLQDKSALWNRGSQSQFGQVAARNGAVVGMSGLQNYTAMAYQYAGQAQGGLGATPPEAEVIPPDYNAMIQGGMALTDANRSFSDSVKQITKSFDDNKNVREMFKSDVSEMKDKLKDGEITNKQYYDSVQKLTSAWKDGTYAADKQSEAMLVLDEQYNQQGAAFALSMMQADEAFDPSKAYDFAAASGLITKQAAEQYKAYEKVKQAVNDNVLSAQQGAYAIKALSGDVAALNGMSSEVWIDIYYRTHGSMVEGWGLTGTTSEGAGPRRMGGEVGFASGGSNIQPGIYNVGEQGTEGLMIGRNGQVSVIPNNTWRDMQRFGIRASGGFAMGTGDAGGGGGLASSGYAYISRRRAASVLASSSGDDFVSNEIMDMKKTVANLTAAVSKMANVTTPRAIDISTKSVRDIGSSVVTSLQQAGAF